MRQQRSEVQRYFHRDQHLIGSVLFVAPATVLGGARSNIDWRIVRGDMAVPPIRATGLLMGFRSEKIDVRTGNVRREGRTNGSEDSEDRNSQR